jgi:hypothetical protein
MALIEPLERQFGHRPSGLRLRRTMPPDTALSFGDLIRKVRMLRVECDKCGRVGTYSLRFLIQHYGREQTILDWKDQLTADCPRRVNGDHSDPCGARCPDLLKVL